MVSAHDANPSAHNTRFSNQSTAFQAKLARFAGIGGGGGSPQVNSDWNASSGVALILNKPALFPGAYSDLTGKPSTFPPSAHNQDISTINGLQGILDKTSAVVNLGTGSIPTSTATPAFGFYAQGNLTLSGGWTSAYSYTGATSNQVVYTSAAGETITRTATATDFYLRAAPVADDTRLEVSVDGAVTGQINLKGMVNPNPAGTAQEKVTIYPIATFLPSGSHTIILRTLDASPYYIDAIETKTTGLAPIDSTKMLNIGDSITVTGATAGTGWCSLLASNRSLTQVNIGEGSAMVDQVISHFWDSMKTYSAIPALVTILAGTNDTNYEQTDYNVFYQRLTDAVKIIRSVNPNVEIIIGQPPYYSIASKDYQSEKFSEVVGKVAVDSAIKLARTHEVYHDASYTSDGIHPNTSGNQKLFEAFRDAKAVGNVAVWTGKSIEGASDRLINPAGAAPELVTQSLISLRAPTPILTPTTGGSLANGTYCYLLSTFDNALNESGRSPETCLTLSGGNNAVIVSHPIVPYAYKYRVYGRASGAQNQYWESTAINPITDTGSSGTAGTAYYASQSPNSWMQWTPKKPGILNAAYLGLGTTTPQYAIDIYGDGSSNYTTYGQTFAARTNYTTAFGGMRFLSLHNNANGALPLSGDLLGRFMAGTSGTNLGLNTELVTGEWVVKAAENFTATSMPTEMYFSSTPSGSTTRAPRLYIRKDGTVEIASGGVLRFGDGSIQSTASTQFNIGQTRNLTGSDYIHSNDSLVTLGTGASPALSSTQTYLPKQAVILRNDTVGSINLLNDGTTINGSSANYPIGAGDAVLLTNDGTNNTWLAIRMIGTAGSNVSVINDLTTGGTTAALSAEMGKTLATRNPVLTTDQIPYSTGAAITGTTGFTYKASESKLTVGTYTSGITAGIHVKGSGTAVASTRIENTAAYGSSSGGVTTMMANTGSSAISGADTRLGAVNLGGAYDSSGSSSNAVMLEGWSEGAWSSTTVKPAYFTVKTSPTSGASVERLRITGNGDHQINGHISYASNSSCTASVAPYSCCTGSGTGTCQAVPTLTSCGTSPTVVGNNNRGKVVIGATGTACTVTFAASPAYSSAPSCWVQGSPMPTAIATTTSVLTITGSPGTYMYGCDDY